jgi:MFS family permease
VDAADDDRPRQFRLFWAATALAAVGDQFFVVALPWLVLQVTGSGVALGAALMTAALPRAALILVAGTLSDRGDPRVLLLAGSGGRAVLISLVALLIYLDAAQVWHFYAFAFGFGALEGLSYPAMATLVPSLVDRERLAAANSRIQSTTQFGAMAAPAMAGAVIAAFGLAAAFAISAAAKVLTTLLYAGMGLEHRRRQKAAAAAPPANAPTTMEVLRGMWLDPAFRAFLILICAMSFAVMGPLAVGAPALAAERFGGSVGFGLMMSASGLGTLLGTILGGARRRVRYRGKILLGVNAMVGLLLILIGMATRLETAIAAIVVMATGSGFVNVVAMTTLQSVDRAILGRLMAVLMLASVGLTPLSYLLAGVLVDVNTAVLFAGAGGLVLVITLYGALNRPLRTVD